MKNDLFDKMRGYKSEFVFEARKSKKIYNYPGVFANDKEEKILKALRYALIEYGTVSDIEFDHDEIEIQITLKPKGH